MLGSHVISSPMPCTRPTEGFRRSREAYGVIPVKLHANGVVDNLLADTACRRQLMRPENRLQTTTRGTRCSSDAGSSTTACNSALDPPRSRSFGHTLDNSAQFGLNRRQRDTLLRCTPVLHCVGRPAVTWQILASLCHGKLHTKGGE